MSTSRAPNVRSSSGSTITESTSAEATPIVSAWANDASPRCDVKARLPKAAMVVADVRATLRPVPASVRARSPRSARKRWTTWTPS